MTSLLALTGVSPAACPLPLQQEEGEEYASLRATLKAAGGLDPAAAMLGRLSFVSRAVGAAPPDAAALLAFEELARMTRVGGRASVKKNTVWMPPCTTAASCMPAAAVLTAPGPPPSR